MNAPFATLVQTNPKALDAGERYAEWVWAELLKVGIDLDAGDRWDHIHLWGVKRSDETRQTWHISYR